MHLPQCNRVDFIYRAAGRCDFSRHRSEQGSHACRQCHGQCAPECHEGTGEYICDSVITTKVKAAVLNEPSLKSAEINVEMTFGDLRLLRREPIHSKFAAPQLVLAFLIAQVFGVTVVSMQPCAPVATGGVAPLA